MQTSSTQESWRDRGVHESSCSLPTIHPVPSPSEKAAWRQYCPRAAPTRALSLDARLLYARSRRNGVGSGERCRDTKRVGPNPQRASGSHWLSRMGWPRKRASPGESSLVAARDSTLMRGAPRSTPSRTRARTPNRGRAKAQFLRPNKKSRRAEPRSQFLTLHTLL